MKALIKRLPVIKGIIAKREQAQLEAQAAAAFQAYWTWWESLSDDQALKVAGF
jgi:hypothetical protein